VSITESGSSLDCPPSLNAFVAAGGVIVPVDMTDEGA
jgi:hypothetical protein